MICGYFMLDIEKCRISIIKMKPSIFSGRHFYLRLRAQWFTNGVALNAVTNFKFFSISENSLKRSSKIFNLLRI